MRPSWIKRQRGLPALHRYGLFACRYCKRLLIGRKGQKTKICIYCGKKQWLYDKRVFFGHENCRMVALYKAGLEAGREPPRLQSALDLLKTQATHRKPDPPGHDLPEFMQRPYQDLRPGIWAPMGSEGTQEVMSQP
ncbi:MAG: hypothetical protein QXT16_08725 [Candidatus Caldarchaeum sp.]